MPQRPTLIFRVPLPHVAPEADQRFRSTHDFFSRWGIQARLSAETPYPISGSWAELATDALAFAAGAVANHYADAVLSAFDAVLKQGVSRLLHLCVKCGEREVYKKVELNRRAEARCQIEDALFELSLDEGGTAYWLRDAKVDASGAITFQVSGWKGQGYFSTQTTAQPSDPDYAFYQWVVTKKRPEVLLSTRDLDALRNSFTAAGPCGPQAPNAVNPGC